MLSNAEMRLTNALGFLLYFLLYFLLVESQREQAPTYKHVIFEILLEMGQ